MARAHTKRGFSWEDVMDFHFTPRPGRTRRARGVFYLNEAAEYRRLANIVKRRSDGLFADRHGVVTDINPYERCRAYIRKAAETRALFAGI